MHIFHLHIRSFYRSGEFQIFMRNRCFVSGLISKQLPGMPIIRSIQFIGMIVCLFGSLRIYVLFGKVDLNRVYLYFLTKVHYEMLTCITAFCRPPRPDILIRCFLRFKARKRRRSHTSFIERLKHPTESRDILRLKLLLRQ